MGTEPPVGERDRRRVLSEMTKCPCNTASKLQLVKRTAIRLAVTGAACTNDGRTITQA